MNNERIPGNQVLCLSIPPSNSAVFRLEKIFIKTLANADFRILYQDAYPPTRHNAAPSRSILTYKSEVAATETTYFPFDQYSSKRRWLRPGNDASSLGTRHSSSSAYDLTPVIYYPDLPRKTSFCKSVMHPKDCQVAESRLCNIHVSRFFFPVLEKLSIPLVILVAIYSR